MEENLQEQGAVPSQGKPTHSVLLPYLPTLRVCSLWTQPDNAQLLRHPACRDLRRSNILLYESKRHCQLYHVLQDAEESVRKRRCKALLKVWRRNTTTHPASVRLHVTKQRRSSKRMEGVTIFEVAAILWAQWEVPLKRRTSQRRLTGGRAGNADDSISVRWFVPSSRAFLRSFLHA